MKPNRKVPPVNIVPKFWLILLPAFFAGMTGMIAGPTLGAHALAYLSCGGGGGLATQPTVTQTSGSTILAWVGRGTISQFTSATVPKDNQGNTYTLIGSVHDYSPFWPASGEALYACPNAAGGRGDILSAPMTGPDEITLAAVEIVHGGVIEDAQWNMVTNPPQTSLNVTTSGAATLVAIWCGDSGANLVTAVPNNGFTTIDAQLLAACQVEVVVATKEVVGAGTYNVTWTATPVQGAHMYLVAVQSLPPPVLEAQVSGGNLAVAWPTSADGYGLETTTNLLRSSIWSPVTNLPATVGSFNVVTQAMSSGSEFFRLTKP